MTDKTGPSVPNWIAKAVILTPSYSGPASIMKMTGWRATRTQVVVRTERGERRFYLDGLTEVGDKNFGLMKTRLAAPNDPQAIAARRQRVVNGVLGSVLTTVNELRLQDSEQTPEAAFVKLTRLQLVVNKAMADLGSVLE